MVTAKYSSGKKSFMQTYSFYYDSILSFHALPVDDINRSGSVLVQIFSGQAYETVLEKILAETAIFFPDAVVAGITTDGEIAQEKISSHRILVVVTHFSSARIASFALDNIDEEHAFESGVVLAKKVRKRNMRFTLLFSDGLGFGADTLLKGFRSELPSSVPLLGAVAGDNAKFFETYLFHGEKLLKNGAVAVSFCGKNLSLKVHHLNTVKRVGPRFRITRSDGQIVRDIEGIETQAFLKETLGEEYLLQLPAASFDIPFVSGDDRRPKADIVTERYEDGSIRLLRGLDQGASWTFGYLDRETLWREISTIDAIAASDADVHWVFASAARRRVVPGIVQSQINCLSATAPVVGAFGYGEFFIPSGENKTHDKPKETHIYTHTMVVASLTERPRSPHRPTEEEKCEYGPPLRRDEESLLQTALLHLSSYMLSKIEMDEGALKLLMDEVPYGILLYTPQLQLKKANETAWRFLGLDARLGDDRSLRNLEPWIVKLLEKGLSEERYVMVDEIFDPETGRKRNLRITTTAIESDGVVVGAMATIKEERKGVIRDERG